MKQYLICSDIDGTLMQPNRKISEPTLKKIRQLQADGHIFAVATGRMPVAAGEVARMIGPETNIIACNGAYIASPGEEITELRLGRDAALLAYDLLKKYNIPFFFFAKNGIYYNQLSPKRFDLADRDRVDTKSKATQIVCIEERDSFLEYADEYINAVAISEDDLETLEKVRVELKQESRLHIESSHFNNIEIIPLGTTKGQAVAKLCAYYNIPIENTIAFGDGENDISMLQAAGIGVAMGNADEAVKAIADAITTTNDQDGIVQFLKTMNL